MWHRMLVTLQDHRAKMVIIKEIVNHTLLRDFSFVRGVISKNEKNTTKCNKGQWNFLSLRELFRVVFAIYVTIVSVRLFSPL